MVWVRHAFNGIKKPGVNCLLVVPTANIVYHSLRTYQISFSLHGFYFLNTAMINVKKHLSSREFVRITKASCVVLAKPLTSTIYFLMWCAYTARRRTDKNSRFHCDSHSYKAVMRVASQLFRKTCYSMQSNSARISQKAVVRPFATAPQSNF